MKRRYKLTLASRGIGVLTAATAFQLSRHNYEEPAYAVVDSFERLELRRYEPRVVAETLVEDLDDERGATSEGFRRLAGYIFGGNIDASAVSMTTPVESTPATSSVSIDMTTPVEAARRDGAWVVRFTMPRELTLEALPVPNDDRVTLREMPPETLAVMTFSGRASSSDLPRRSAQLRDSLVGLGLEAVGEPVLAQYDPPWVLGALRRNEIQVPVRGELNSGG